MTYTLYQLARRRELGAVCGIANRPGDCYQLARRRELGGPLHPAGG